MGFRAGAYAKVWEVSRVSDTLTNMRVSISRKNKKTGEYEQDFSGYVSAVGTAAASKAMKLREGDRIKLGDVDVTSSYDKEKKRGFNNFKVFNFEVEPGNRSNNRVKSVDDGEPPEYNGRLPY